MKNNIKLWKIKLQIWCSLVNFLAFICTPLRKFDGLLTEIASDFPKNIVLLLGITLGVTAASVVDWNIQAGLKGLGNCLSDLCGNLVWLVPNIWLIILRLLLL